MLRDRLVLGLTIVLLGVPASARAHHSFAAEFDANQPVTITGTITKIEFTNPHGWIHVDVKAADGKIVSYAIETAGPNALFRRGWTRTSMKIGDEVTVDGWRAKNGLPVVNGRSFKLKDGRDLFAASSGAPGVDQ